MFGNLQYRGFRVFGKKEELTLTYFFEYRLGTRPFTKYASEKI
jgi:hypothetical protein